MAKDGQFIQLEGFAELLFPGVLKGPALLEANQHQMVPVGLGQGLTRFVDSRGGFTQAGIRFDLPALQHHQITLARPPELKIEDLATDCAARLVDGEPLGGEGLEEGANLLFSIQGPGQGPLGLALQGLPQLAHGLEAEPEPGGHQVTLRKGVKSMPKIWPMASMAWWWLEPSAVAWRRKDWMAGWNWMAWSMLVLEPLM